MSFFLMLIKQLQGNQLHSTLSPSLSGPSGSRGALGALMTCLRAARAQGVVSPPEEGLWGGLVPLPLLRQALIHKHDQVSII